MRDAEITLKQREQEKRLTENERRVADTLSQFKNEKRESEKELAENHQHVRLQALSVHYNPTSVGDSGPPRHNAWSNVDMMSALPAGCSMYSLPPQSTITAMLLASHTPQINVQSHVTATQSTPTSQRIHPQQPPSQATPNVRSSGDHHAA